VAPGLARRGARHARRRRARPRPLSLRPRRAARRRGVDLPLGRLGLGRTPRLGGPRAALRRRHLPPPAAAPRRLRRGGRRALTRRGHASIACTSLLWATRRAYATRVT